MLYCVHVYICPDIQGISYMCSVLGYSIPSYIIPVGDLKGGNINVSIPMRGRIKESHWVIN